MVDLSAEMAELWASLGGTSLGRARAVQFVAARRGEGVSTVAREFATGRTYTEITGRLGVAPKTVRNQLQSVYGKLGVKSKVALVKRLAAEH